MEAQAALKDKTRRAGGTSGAPLRVPHHNCRYVEAAPCSTDLPADNPWHHSPLHLTLKINLDQRTAGLILPYPLIWASVQDKNKTMQLQDFHRVLSLWDLTLPFPLTTHMSCCSAAFQLSQVLSTASSQEKDAGSKEGIAEGRGSGGHAQGGLTCKGPSEDWILCSGISETGM